MSTNENIRNFSIIAHINHGKSTLADRLIHKCGGLTDREMKEQVLDSMDIERERGITIKAQTVRLNYNAKDGKNYVLNIIDTPGHVDFSYEVSRSLSACEGSILIVDSSQGVEAQTLANVYQALDNNHKIIPVLNKIDLPAADTEKVKKQIEDVIGIDTTHSINCSGKTGEGVEDILESIIKVLPPPKGNVKSPLKSLLVDSWYDSYLGVVILVRVIDGSLKKGMEIKMMSNDSKHVIEKVGVFTPKPKDVDKISSGEIGFIITGIKNLSDKSYSIVRGTANGKYLISAFIKDETLPKVGDLLVTSGNAKIFPRDILVGKVILVREDDYLAIPYVDFNNLGYVQVIKSK